MAPNKSCSRPVFELVEKSIMEKSKTFKVKQTQAGDDSGYSCTSTQSKYSQSASSGDSCFGERQTSNTTDKRKILHSNSTSQKKQSKAVSRDVSGLKTNVNSETNNNCSKSEQTTFEPQRDQSNIDVSESKEPTSLLKMGVDDSNDLNDGIKEDHDKNNSAFLQLANICQSYRDFLNTKNLTPNSSDESTSTDTRLFLEKSFLDCDKEKQSDESHENTFGVVVSMNNGFVINTSDNIYRSMGYPKNMWQGRSFIDFIHPEDRESFISYVTSVLTNPRTVLRKDGTSFVTFLSAKNNDGFYCNMRRYNGLVNTGFSLYQKQNLYQVCKLTITFKDTSHFSSASSTLATFNDIIQPQLLIINAQLIYSAYTYSEEKNERPMTFITKHNALFKWCYVDHLIISHFGYLPQNIIGKSIFAYYNIDDLSTIKEIYENITTPRNVPYKGSPYRFKCQNGDFALIQTEWSNFVNPWSGRVEFVVGKHKVIQGPVNPDVTTPVDDLTSKEKLTENIKTENEAYEDIKKILNKNIYEDIDVSLQINQTPALSSSAKQQLSKKYIDIELSMSNCFVEDPSINVPLEVKVHPEMCGSFSNHDSIIFGGISPHHNYESKSSSETPLSYNQLNYNDNILRFFKSNLHTNSSDDELTQTEGKSTPFDNDMDKVQQEMSSLLQSATSSSSITVNDTSTNCYQNLDENMSQSSQQPLTQKMLLRHNKKMEDDLVKQHKNKAKKNKTNEKQQQKLPEENKDTSDINHGIKRSNSSQYEENPCKLAKKKHQANSNPTNVFTQTQESKNIESDTSTVARSTQIWPPCKITRDSQTTVDLPCQVLCYNVPLTNNVMPVKHNEYDNIFTLMDSSGQNQEFLPALLQPMNVPLYATIPIMNHISQNPQITQPCSLLYHNQLLLQPYENNVQCNNQIQLPNENPNPMLPKTDLYQIATTITEIKKRAAESMEAPAVAINQCIDSMTVAGKGALPAISSLKKTMRRVRNYNDPQMPVAPLTLYDLAIPDLFKTYEVEPGNFENFLLCDTGPGLSRILIFGRQRGLEILRTSDEWFVDGTFRIAPDLFSQVFVIMGCRNGGVHPCLYALLPKKEQATYTTLLVEIKRLVPGINVGSISVDFEVAIHNAFKNEFPNVEIRGCFFHLLQNLKKQIGAAGLMTDYRNDADFNLYSRMITALAFVPPDDVAMQFEALSEELERLCPRLQPILDWLEMYYIGMLRREGVRRLPMFPILTWNLYNRVLAEHMKTNNISEAAHRRLQAQLSMTNPTLWRFVNELKKVQAERDIYYEFLVAGNLPPATKRKYIDASNRILRLVRDYRNRNITEYLRGLAHNFVMDH